MKITGTFLLLATGAAAFTPAAKPFTFKAATDSSSAVFSSYLSDINNSNRNGVRRNDVGRTRAPEVGRVPRDVQIGRNDFAAPMVRRGSDDQVVCKDTLERVRYAFRG